MSTFTPSLPESTVPLPHSFASASSRPPTSLPLKKQYAQYSALTAPFPSISITRKRSSKIHTRHFGSSRVSPTITPPFQQRSPKETPSLTTVDIPSDTLSPVHDLPSISPPTPSHNSNHTWFPATPTSPSSILWGPSPAGTSSSPPTYGNRATSTKSDVLTHSDEDTTTCLYDSVSLHNSDPKGWGSSELEDRVAQVIKRVTGEGVTEEMLPDNSLRSSQEHGSRRRYRHPRQHRSSPRQQQHGPRGRPQSYKGPLMVDNSGDAFSPMHNGRSSPLTYQTTPPFQQRSPIFCPGSDTFQLYQNKRRLSNPSSCSQQRQHNPQHSESLYSRPLSPFLPRRRCASLPPSFRHLKNTRNERSMTPPSTYPSNSSPTHPFQRQSLGFYSPWDTLQPYRDHQWTPKEPQSPTTFDNSRDTSSSIHDVPSVSPTPSHGLSQTRPPTPSPSNQRSSSLSPPFRRHDNFRGQQLWRRWPGVGWADVRHHYRLNSLPRFQLLRLWCSTRHQSTLDCAPLKSC